LWSFGTSALSIRLGVVFSLTGVDGEGSVADGVAELSNEHGLLRVARGVVIVVSSPISPHPTQRGCVMAVRLHVLKTEWQRYKKERETHMSFSTASSYSLASCLWVRQLPGGGKGETQDTRMYAWESRRVRLLLGDDTARNCNTHP